ncbi:hypothetical protein NEUTE1DRAFT_106762 [Neurospora tetrasperma FGSC 2508]|uniref:Uncharacterized protein n=1 Tax=Neurospora tetrasperma (strain FGSC 2508 / ATCC MYA-4615 / P0657) TaxID=510951 RepID=F8MAI1_NEUT8|nr:uncharacterized protein NEUTE1DRAFT_106762 [Neurospora tetrasperma FGSC 2508]EGO60102.1 hypothetical protein NEUTE1DRAFT_106762 [Neurospora tetrasperma FGSC 2508]EGZ75948.1 hypothetical protein NEUTE2DRAFT_56626 [Neurospora tetrasperma FGSC 2509]
MSDPKPIDAQPACPSAVSQNDVTVAASGWNENLESTIAQCREYEEITGDVWATYYLHGCEQEKAKGPPTSGEEALSFLKSLYHIRRAMTIYGQPDNLNVGDANTPGTTTTGVPPKTFSLSWGDGSPITIDIHTQPTATIKIVTNDHALVTVSTRQGNGNKMDLKIHDSSTIEFEAAGGTVTRCTKEVRGSMTITVKSSGTVTWNQTPSPAVRDDENDQGVDEP